MSFCGLDLADRIPAQHDDGLWALSLHHLGKSGEDHVSLASSCSFPASQQTDGSHALTPEPTPCVHRPSCQPPVVGPYYGSRRSHGLDEGSSSWPTSSVTEHSTYGADSALQCITHSVLLRVKDVILIPSPNLSGGEEARPFYTTWASCAEPAQYPIQQLQLLANRPFG